MPVSLFYLLVLALCQHTVAFSADGGLRGSRKLLAEVASTQQPTAFDLTAPIDGQVIAFFTAGTTDAAAAAAQLTTEVQAAIAGDASEVATATAAAEPFEVVSTFDAASDEVSAASSSSSAAAAAGLVIRASPAVARHIKASKLVAKVISDRVVATQSIACVEAATLGSAGVTTTPSKSFSWPKCLTSKSRLVWAGRSCGGAKVVYTELRAVDIKTGAIVRVNNKPCILKPDATKASWTRQRLGSCGKAPTWAPALPGTLCAASSSVDPKPTPPPSPAVEASPSPSPAVEASPSPSPDTEQPSSSPRLRRAPVAAGEQLPPSISRIEAATAAGVVSTAGLPLERQVVVGVMDSGVDETHPDINYFGGKAWNKPAAGKVDDANPGTDNYGHGTHVSGIIGARNNGAGVVGVAPGTPLFSLKVLDGNGKGTLSSVLSAVKWVVAEGKAQGIKVINLSLAAYVDPESEDYADTVDVVCGIMKEATDAGVFVAAAAGNYGSDLQGYLPAACPTVAVVTAVENNAPASFSNFLPDTASDVQKAHIIAAPGTSVLSTISYARDASGYKILSGTSQASPHVAGIAATCIMAGDCASSATGADMLATIQAAAAERYAANPGYGFTGDAKAPVNGKLYGLLSWAGKY